MRPCTVAALQVRQARHVVGPVRSQLWLGLDTTAALQVWQAWLVVAPIRPQLYLSSQADALIPPAEVSLFMKQQVYGTSYNAGILWCEGQHRSIKLPKEKELALLSMRFHLNLDACCQENRCTVACLFLGSSVVFFQCTSVLQAARGVLVSSRIFSDSAHCEHYRKHPVEYHEEVERFIASLAIAR